MPSEPQNPSTRVDATAASAPRPHRPAGITRQVPSPGAADEVPGRRADLAEELADALLALGRRDAGAALARADELGVVELGETWHGADPVSRPGLLWTLHLLRTWCQFRGGEAARLYEDGRDAEPVQDAVAGLPALVGAADVAALGDVLLLAAYAGELGAAAERAAALLLVTAAGLSATASADRDDPARASDASVQAARARTTARRLTRTAHAWRAGQLR